MRDSTRGKIQQLTFITRQVLSLRTYSYIHSYEEGGVEVHGRKKL